MVYAKVYPATLIEEYRKTIRATYRDFHGPGGNRVPTPPNGRRSARACSCATAKEERRADLSADAVQS
jgi:hypothetical protein